MHALSRSVLGLILIAALSTMLVAMPVMAQASLTIEVKEKGCGGDHVWCFQVTEGDLDDISPGEEVTILFKNTGDSPHQLDIVTLADMDPDRERTSRSDAIANTTASMAVGAQETITFTVPADAEGLYLFCGVAGHEGLGMWLETDWGADEENASPAPTFLAGVLLALGLTWNQRRRQR